MIQIRNGVRFQRRTREPISLVIGNGLSHMNCRIFFDLFNRSLILHLLLFFHLGYSGRGRGGHDDRNRSNDGGRSSWGGDGGGASYPPPNDYHRQQQHGRGRGFGYDQPNRYAIVVHCPIYFRLSSVERGGGSLLILFVTRESVKSFQVLKRLDDVMQ